MARLRNAVQSIPASSATARRLWPLLGLVAAFVLTAILAPALQQPLAYHDFADQRAWFGVANFFDVTSNLAFLIAGMLGLLVVWCRRGHFECLAESIPYFVFFLGVSLTAFGSAYYHLVPDNERLVWDRLPMTIAFMSLLATQLIERVSLRLGLALLAPMLAVGAATVLYWIATERGAAGNVVPYAALQGYAVVALLVLTVGYPSRYTRGNDLYQVFGAYLLAKLLEHFDQQLLAMGGLLSGHTLKHIVAAIAAVLVCRMLWLRAVVRTGQE